MCVYVCIYVFFFLIIEMMYEKLKDAGYENVSRQYFTVSQRYVCHSACVCACVVCTCMCECACV